jgi:hypothetical protein
VIADEDEVVGGGRAHILGDPPTEGFFGTWDGIT